VDRPEHATWIVLGRDGGGVGALAIDADGAARERRLIPIESLPAWVAAVAGDQTAGLGVLGELGG
jgi:hypothetical protein